MKEQITKQRFSLLSVYWPSRARQRDFRGFDRLPCDGKVTGLTVTINRPDALTALAALLHPTSDGCLLPEQTKELEARGQNESQLVYSRRKEWPADG